MPLSPLTCPGPALNTQTLWVPFDVLTTIAGRMWHRIKYVENDHIQDSDSTTQPSQPSTGYISKVILWVPFAVLPTLVWWWWVQWLVARQRAVWSTAQRWCGARQRHSSGCAVTRPLQPGVLTLGAPHPAPPPSPCLVTGLRLFIPHSSIYKPPWLLLYCLICQPWAADAKLYKVRSEADNY